MSAAPGARNPERFIPTLERIRAILLEHEFFWQATVVADLIDLAHLDSRDFAGRASGGEIWGSSGSVADGVRLGRSLDQVDAETQRDSVELRRALIRLADELRAQGISSERSEFVANVFRRGLEMRDSEERES